MVDAVSEREVLEIAERLASHEVLSEKTAHYAAQAIDAELARILWQHAQVYTNLCRELASLLNRLQHRSGWSAYNRREQRITPVDWEHEREAFRRSYSG